MRPVSLVVAAALGLGAFAADAGQLDLNLSNDTVRLGIAQKLTPTGLEAGGHFLHHQDHGNVGGLEIHLVDDASPGRGALDVGVGARAYVYDSDDRNEDGGGLGVGGKFRWTWPTHNRIGIGGFVYYAPPVVSFDEIDSLVDTGVRLEYLVLRRAGVYVGYRYVAVELKNGDDDTFDSGAHVGFTLRF